MLPQTVGYSTGNKNNGPILQAAVLVSKHPKATCTCTLVVINPSQSMGYMITSYNKKKKPAARLCKGQNTFRDKRLRVHKLQQSLPVPAA